ncbi:hypothetical protein LIER_22020 [Lithospermum erythrorhizon]|uniref:Reverse transcriptase domain-containing protein n=1 Tax=Lithospermum erythrorhizon TaxID=34254 RepID=A0AAV3QVF2_LITER
MGDFNVVKGLSEQVGCKSLDNRALEDFNDCLLNCRLEDAGYIGSSLSWTNGLIAKRLDRVMHNQEFGELFPHIKFKHPTFLRVVEDTWRLPIHGDPLFVLGMKLKRLKEYLNSWNKNVFGNVISMVEQADEEVQQCEAAYEGSSDPVLREALHLAKAKHLRCLAIQEDFSVSKVASNGFRKETKTQAIEESGVKNFRALFMEDTVADDEEMLDCIPSLVTNEDNDRVMVEPDMEELRQIVFSLNKDSLGGPNGFNGHFFDNFWSLIAADLLAAVKHFMAGSSLHQSFTSTALALIPKKDNPKSWKEYTPISLCSFVNKIISKLLSTRIAPILPKLISENQAGFVRGGLIQDNILLAQEMMHHIDKGDKYGNVILNLDMSKAFDRLS